MRERAAEHGVSRLQIPLEAQTERQGSGSGCWDEERGWGQQTLPTRCHCLASRPSQGRPRGSCGPSTTGQGGPNPEVIQVLCLPVLKCALAPGPGRSLGAQKIFPGFCLGSDVTFKFGCVPSPSGSPLNAFIQH